MLHEIGRRATVPRRDTLALTFAVGMEALRE